MPRPWPARLTLTCYNDPRFIILDALWITRHAVVDTEHSDHVEFVGNWQSSVSRDGFSGSNYHFFEGCVCGPVGNGVVAGLRPG